MAIDPDATSHSSRGRLIAAARTLFAQNGYEQTSTASLAREAGTSESQLVRYFGSKAGLLEAVFDASWSVLQQEVLNATAAAPSAREALEATLNIIIQSFTRDPEIAYLLLFEGRRIRGPEHEIVLSKGFRQFNQLLQQLIRRGHADGSFNAGLSVPALSSALLGAAEGMIRDRLTAQRAGDPEPFSTDDVRSAFTRMLQAC